MKSKDEGMERDTETEVFLCRDRVKETEGF